MFLGRKRQASSGTRVAVVEGLEHFGGGEHAVILCIKTINIRGGGGRGKERKRIKVQWVRHLGMSCVNSRSRGPKFRQKA